jgi:hypothetical protein
VNGWRIQRTRPRLNDNKGEQKHENYATNAAEHTPKLATQTTTVEWPYGRKSALETWTKVKRPDGFLVIDAAMNVRSDEASI